MEKYFQAFGILPTSDNIIGTKKLYKAVKQRLDEKCPIIIYPEAHVWPYYTKIRPFENAAFKFQVDFDAVSFSMTTTYYKRKGKAKPGIKVYIDGPFMVDKTLSKKEKVDVLSKVVHDKMNERSQNSTYEYVEYRRE